MEKRHATQRAHARFRRDPHAYLANFETTFRKAALPPYFFFFAGSLTGFVFSFGGLLGGVLMLEPHFRQVNRTESLVTTVGVA